LGGRRSRRRLITTAKPAGIYCGIDDEVDADIDINLFSFYYRLCVSLGDIFGRDAVGHFRQTAKPFYSANVLDVGGGR
jgi:hypothetical protein